MENAFTAKLLNLDDEGVDRAPNTLFDADLGAVPKPLVEANALNELVDGLEGVGVNAEDGKVLLASGVAGGACAPAADGTSEDLGCTGDEVTGGGRSFADEEPRGTKGTAKEVLALGFCTCGGVGGRVGETAPNGETLGGATAANGEAVEENAEKDCSEVSRRETGRVTYGRGHRDGCGERDGSWRGRVGSGNRVGERSIHKRDVCGLLLCVRKHLG